VVQQRKNVDGRRWWQCRRHEGAHDFATYWSFDKAAASQVQSVISRHAALWQVMLN
jgi:hypothetical protein